MDNARRCRARVLPLAAPAGRPGWTGSLARLAEAAQAQGLPFTPHKLTPALEDSFWVNVIGRGYPAPRQKFRWCTERMKIRPSNKFIRDVVRRYGEAILVLGTRKAESQVRAARMEKLEAQLKALSHNGSGGRAERAGGRRG